MAKMRRKEELEKQDLIEVGRPKVLQNTKTGEMWISAGDQLFKLNAAAVVAPANESARQVHDRKVPGYSIGSYRKLMADTRILPSTITVSAAKEESPLEIKLLRIQTYIEKEKDRISKQYKGEQAEYLTFMIAHRVALMITDPVYETLSVQALNKLFSQFGMTYKEAMNLLEDDANCPEL